MFPQLLISNLHHATTNFQFKIKDSLDIQWNEPSINQQLKHFQLNFFVELLRYHVFFPSFFM